MNSQVARAAITFCRSSSVAVLVLWLFAAAPSGRAQVVNATLTNNGSSTVTIASNQSFSLTLMVNTNFPSSGISFFLQSNLAGSGLFTITNIDRTGSPFPDWEPLIVPCGIACVLNPSNDFDLGSSSFSGSPSPAGAYTIATITFSTANAPPGQYTISTDRGIMTDRTGGGFNDVPFFTFATINVVPEPGAVVLALVGGSSLLAVLRRKKKGR